MSTTRLSLLPNPHTRNCRQGDYFGPVDAFGRLIDPHTGKPGAFPDENPMLQG